MSALDHLSFRVWATYIVASDDFGVMPEEASVIKSTNRGLKKTSDRAIAQAMKRLAEGLLRRFTWQGQAYLWQPDWQAWQGIRYPRATTHPMPAFEDLRTFADTETQILFSKHREASQRNSGNPSETSPTPVCAGGRETLPLTQPLTQTLPQTPDAEMAETPARDADGRALGSGGAWGNTHQRRNGLASNRHLKCYTSPACARGYCVPQFFGDQCAEQLGMGDPEAGRRAFLAFVDATLAQTPAGPVGDSLKFWRDAFDRAYAKPTARGRATGGSHTAVDADKYADVMERDEVADV